MIQEIRSEPLLTVRTPPTYEAPALNYFPASIFRSEPLNIHATKAGSLDSSISQGLPFALPRLGDVVEIQGPPASGKSHLLYLLMCICIIPTTHASISLGGWDKVVLFFDTDASFDLVRFERLLTSHLEAALNTNISTVQQLVKRSLKNLHIFRPTSSIQLAATLLCLPSYHHTKLPDSEIGILAVDSMSAFYWLDRFTAEQLRATNVPGVKELTNPLQHVITALQRFHRTHRPLVVLTNWGLTSTQSNFGIDRRGVPTYRQHLNPPPALFPDLEADSAPVHSFILPLTLHITLSMSPCPNPSTICQILGVVRSAISSQTNRFTFNIEADRIDALVSSPTKDH
ncbi:hypothetical protein DFH05DRAFT_1531800 [Lentinula detonsa]|uniref:DNA recombination and repair protein Rad51-like C-terminal domain-containing protein n=1 Tax=Lentinula detonsa TaxID=2804962 RepID=A0A9W8PAI0_9AGAR|nr:hypothetical protein DFH05DRAFT_1531800 [Lentinula detonsa]